MAQPTDTSSIQRLLGRARFRIRSQWAIEGATTAVIVAAAAALGAIFAVRAELVSASTGIALLVASAAIVVIGAVIAASRRLEDEHVARRIDRASNLADRLSTAIAFQRAFAAGTPADADEDTTHALMHAAIADGLRAAPKADVRAATPFEAPKDLRAALGFLAVSALAAGLSLPTPDRAVHVTRALPDHAPPGTEVVIEGDHLRAGTAPPADGRVTFESPGKSQPLTLLDWTPTQIKVVIPPTAAFGEGKLTVFAAGGTLGSVAFTIVDPKDQRYHKDDAVALDPDEKPYVEAILGELRDVARRDNVPELEDFAKQIEKMLKQAENGEITKEQLLDALAKAEDALHKDAEPNPAEIQKQLGEIGKELAQKPLTKELGEALQKNDLDKAQKELEKLADKLDQKQLSDAQKQELQKQLEQVAKQMDKQDQQAEKQQDNQQKKIEDEIRRLEKDKPKNEQQRQENERRLEDKKRELAKLKKDEQDKQQSDQRRALKRLEKDVEKAAENLEKPQKDPNKSKDQQDQEQEQRDKQASQKLKDAARETGRVDKDQRKQASQKKLSSQMEELREAMQRAKQKGNKGPSDPFNKNGKNQDYISRARGQKSGHGQSWKPGQGPGQGQGQQGQGQGQGSGQGSGGSGQQPGGDEWGVGHDDNLVGDPTAKSGHEHDEQLEGKPGQNGGSTRETILAAAQKGFASTGYKKVFASYEQIVEEVMRTEKLPSSYKYFVKRYFAKIHPNMSAPSDGAAPAPAPTPTPPGAPAP